MAVDSTGLDSEVRGVLGCMVTWLRILLHPFLCPCFASNLGIPEAGLGSLKSRRVDMASSAPLHCGRNKPIPGPIRRRGYRSFPLFPASQGPSALPRAVFAPRKREQSRGASMLGHLRELTVQSGLTKRMVTVTCILYTTLYYIVQGNVMAAVMGEWGAQNNCFLSPLRNCFAVLELDFSRLPSPRSGTQVPGCPIFPRLGLAEGKGRTPTIYPTMTRLAACARPPHADSQPYQELPSARSLAWIRVNTPHRPEHSKHGGLSTRLLHCHGQPGRYYCPRSVTCTPSPHRNRPAKSTDSEFDQQTRPSSISISTSKTTKVTICWPLRTPYLPLAF